MSKASNTGAVPGAIEVIEKQFGPVLEIEHRASMFTMPKQMGSGFARIDAYLREKGREPKEPPYARYPEIDWEADLKRGPLAFLRMFFKKWHFFTGFPSGAPVDGTGSIRAGDLGRRRYVACLYVGPYRNVGKTYEAMYAFAKEQGLTLESWCMEQYLNDPTEAGQEKAETMCLIPIRE